MPDTPNVMPRIVLALAFALNVAFAAYVFT
jgi:hypothetical protein